MLVFSDRSPYKTDANSGAFFLALKLEARSPNFETTTKCSKTEIRNELFISDIPALGNSNLFRISCPPSDGLVLRRASIFEFS
jgi:hypothetical protein